MHYYFWIKQLLYGYLIEVIKFCTFVKKLYAQNKGRLRELEYTVNQIYIYIYIYIYIRITELLNFVHRLLF
jgi:hypothetical protein